MLTTNPTPTPAPTRTPTPPPLSDACLRELFSDDAPICQSAPSYDIELTIDPTSTSVSGSQVITYTNAESEASDEIILLLLPDAPGYGGTMTVMNLLLSGQSVLYETEPQGTTLRVPLEPPLEPLRMVKLSMDFAVYIPTLGISGHGLYSYVQGVMALPTVYPIIPVRNDRGWSTDVAPVHGDDVFSNVAICDVQVSAPPTFKLTVTGARGTPVEGTWACKAASVQDFTVVLGEHYERADAIPHAVFLQTYYARHRYRIATTDSFLDTIKDVAGDRHEDLYETGISGNVPRS